MDDRFSMESGGRVVVLIFGLDYGPKDVARLIEHGRQQLAEHVATGKIVFRRKGERFDHPDALMSQLFPGTFPTWREQLSWEA